MPSRVIREGLLDSQRYWSVSIEARQLFFHLMLIADDFGLVSLAPVHIRRRCFDDAPSQQRIDKQIEQLVDADLIRLYSAGDGLAAARYAFIPRYRQTLRIEKSRVPVLPPAAMYADDEHAQKMFLRNKEKMERMRVGSTAAAPQPQSICSLEVEVESKKEKEVESKTADPLKSTATAAQQEKPLDLLTWGASQGIEREQGETDIRYKQRLGFEYGRSRQAQSVAGSAS
jgi:hypothetical protein